MLASQLYIDELTALDPEIDYFGHVRDGRLMPRTPSFTSLHATRPGGGGHEYQQHGLPQEGRASKVPGGLAIAHGSVVNTHADHQRAIKREGSTLLEATKGSRLGADVS